MRVDVSFGNRIGKGIESIILRDKATPIALITTTKCEGHGVLIKSLLFSEKQTLRSTLLGLSKIR